MDIYNKVFDDYVSQYDLTDEDIIYKYNHTYRVCKQSMNICNNLNLNEEQKNIAYLIALLHDIGRFYQDKIYNTYIEKGTGFDHGDYAVKILSEDGLIRKFIETDKYDRLIYVGVKNHNKYAIEKDLTDEELLQCKIIRDADKLDILNNVAIIEKINRKVNDFSNISEKVHKDFMNNSMINNNDSKTNNDGTVKLLSLVYDLNFNYSFKYMKDNNYVKRIFENIKDKERFKIYFEKINKYIDLRCKDVR